MIEILLAGNALIAIAVMLLSIGVQKLYKAQAAENAALRRDLEALEQSNSDVVSASFTSINIAPGDTLMLTTERHLTPEQHATIRAQVDKMLPGVRTVVMAGGLRAVSVLAPTTRT
jgi:hypothetical protein